MGGSGTTIHWHGMRQRKTPYMDGVPFITQCPIAAGDTFRYSFWAEDTGTFFYHSHSGLQKVNGIFGGLAVRGPPATNPHATAYDRDMEEHMIVITDWMKDPAEM